MKLKLLIISLGCLCTLSGCSVVMAAHESEQINLADLTAGTARAKVETVLTNPIEEGGKRANKTVTYQFYSNDEKSYGRAAVYGVLDLATLGFAELATTSIESLQGDKHLVTVEYDPNGKLISLKETVEKAPLDKPERILGIEDNEPKIVPVALTPPAADQPKIQPVALTPPTTDQPKVRPAVLKPPAPQLPQSNRASM